MPSLRSLSVGPVIRDPHEEHRTSTPLELFVDLAYVVAVAQAAASLHHELVEGRVGYGVVGFLMAFFGIWWAWMNVTWFASAHDADDVPHRLLTLVQIGGALVYAAGVPAAVEDHTFTLGVVGYLLMRLALVTQWLRIARHLPQRRPSARRYAGGITVVQLLWILLLATPPGWTPFVFLVLGSAEMAVPAWAERANRGTALWRLFHPEHIEERYGLFTIIVLGESLLSATVGIRAVAQEGVTAGLVIVAVGGLLLAFGAWWLYFDHPGHLRPSPAMAIRWGFLHVVVFASLAALGAGLYVAAEAVAGHAGERTGALAVAIPVAGFLVGLVALMLATHHAVRLVSIGPKLAGAVLVVLTASVATVAVTMVVTAMTMVVLVATMVVVEPPVHRVPDAPSRVGR